MPFIVPEEDSGPFAKALIDDAPGTNLIAYRDWLTTEEVVEAFIEATGLQARVVQLPKGHFDNPLPEELQLEISDMIEYMGEFGYEGRDDPTIIHPSVVSGVTNSHLRKPADRTDNKYQLSSPPKLQTSRDYFKKQDWDKILA